MPPAGWFVDADVLGLYHVLHHARRSSAGDVVSGLTPGFPVEVGMADVEWMPLLNGRDFAVITKDARQRWRPAEQQAIRENELGVFAIRSRKDLTTWQQARLIFSRWDDLEQCWDTTRRPFVYTVTRTRSPRREL